MLTLILFIIGFASGHIEAGDRAFEREQYDDAIHCYESALKMTADDAEARWKLARSIVCKADVAPVSEQAGAYKLAMQAAEQSVRLDPRSSDAHTWLAIALGYVAIGEGVRSQIRIAHRIKAEVEEAIRLDPRNDVAYSIEGTLFRSLGNVGWVERQLATVLIGKLPEGGYTEAERALRTATALAPGVIRHRYELGLLYLDWGKDEEAKTVFLDAVRLKPVIASDRARLVDMQKRIQQL